MSREYAAFYQKSISESPSIGLTMEEIRSQFTNFLQAFPPEDGVRFEPFSIGNISAFWAFAPNVNRRRILLFFFGGGFCCGSIESHKNLIGRLSATTNAAVCAIQYRLAPEHPFPAALDDALTAYRWLLHHPYARSRILFGGISSGANLALSLLLRLKLEKIAMPAGALCLCPWIDLSNKTKKGQSDFFTSEWFAYFSEKYIEGKDPTDPLISPLYGNFETLPPLFIQSGTHDLFHAEALQLANSAQKQGVTVFLDIWPGLSHNFELFAPQFPEAEEALEKAGEFVEKIFIGKNTQAVH
ncbi:MAG TPA: alpha/beta hydrolase [Chlamydiales bacterium]|nr:alpha/beta hydrolase [Chlamydiales bacterium]